MTKILVRRHVPSLFSGTIELIERFHDETEHRAGPFSWLQTDVDCAIAETRDYTDSTRRHEALVLQWRTHALFPIPRFRGLITVRLDAPGTELRIEGSYVPPLGEAGRLFDALIGKRVARRTIERFADALQDFVEGKAWSEELHDRNFYQTSVRTGVAVGRFPRSC